MPDSIRDPVGVEQGEHGDERFFILVSTDPTKNGKTIPGVVLLDNTGQPVIPGATTIADGADVTQGAKADGAATDNTGSWSIVALLKGIWGRLRGGQQTSANSLPVVLPSDQTVPVLGTFWQATQPVSGTFFQATQPVSGTVTANMGTGTAAVAGNAASGASDSGNPVKAGGRYNGAAPTLTDGQRGDLQLDANGNLKVSQATQIAGEDLTNNVLKVEQRFTFANITTNTSTAVKTAGGFLHAINVNTAGGPGGKAAVYDNASAATTPIGTIDTTVKGPNLFDVSTTNGIYIVTSVTSGSAADLTVSAR